ncbi:MAG: HAD family hydrolase [Deltaproteobacteria bacterium]|nr:HAD family hydrolase [Deltaproteobacteria bacterium]
MKNREEGAHRQAAFFDLDGTLLTVNSGRLWTIRERRKGRLGNRQALTAALFFFGYKLGVIDMEIAMRKALLTIKGIEEDVIRSRTEKFYEEDVKPHAAPGAFKVVQEHRARGHMLVLLTSSSPYEAECARKHFGFDKALSMMYEVRDGRFTGEVCRPMCYGRGKVEIAENFAQSRGISFENSFFYSDSVTDLPMLERVGNPRVVNPDPRLRIFARKKGWPILDWSTRPE